MWVCLHIIFISAFDITVHRKFKVKTHGIAMPHSKSMMVPQSPKGASHATVHTQRNSQEIVLFWPTGILFASKSILMIKPVIVLQWASGNSLARTGYMLFLRNLTCGTWWNMPRMHMTKCCPECQSMWNPSRCVLKLGAVSCKPISINWPCILRPCVLEVNSHMFISHTLVLALL